MRDFWKVGPLVLLVCFLGAIACTRDVPKESADKTALAVPVVSDSRSDLVLTWFVDGGAGIASSVQQVPEEFRREVRVQDPSIPPEKSDPRWIFMADLTRSGPDGRYPVRAVPRETYERRTAAAVAVAPAPEASGSAAAPGEKKVIMYATRGCPVCREARRWLVDRQIPYTEKDVDQDPEAARDLARKGAAQGVTVKGVPVFEIGGHLIPGFEPDLLIQALSAGRRTATDQVI